MSSLETNNSMMEKQSSNDLSWRMTTSIILTFLLLCLPFFNRGLHLQHAEYIGGWSQLILATPIVFLCGWIILRDGWKNLKMGHITCFTLVAITITLSYLYSLTMLLFPNLFLSMLIMPISIDSNFETAAIVTTIVLIEQYIESYISQKCIIKSDRSNESTSIQNTISVISHYLILCILLLAIITFFSWLLLDITYASTYGFTCAMTVLIIACPFALNFAATLPIHIGINASKQRGISFQNMACLEKFEKTNVLILDSAQLKNISPSTLDKLHAKGIHVIVMTGADYITIETLDKNHSIDAIQTETTPEQKRETIQQLKNQGFTIATTDNNRDSHTTGIRLLSQNDVINIYYQHPEDIISAFLVSKHVMQNIRFNLYFISAYSFLTLLFATGLFFPLVKFMISPALGAALMMAMTATVLFHAWLLHKKLRDHLP